MKAEKFKNWEKNGIHAVLPDVVVAPENYVSDDGKEFFTYPEIIQMIKENVFPEGWRPMTYNEAVLLINEFGLDPDTGEVDPDMFIRVLNMPCKGFVDGYHMKAYNKNPKQFDELDVTLKGSAYYRLISRSRTNENEMPYADILFVHPGNGMPGKALRVGMTGMSYGMTLRLVKSLRDA